jgi:transcriptional regulator with XRE-family HTH domain
MSLDVKQVGRRIRETRESKQLSLRDLAQLARMPEDEILRLESGAIGNIGFECLAELSRALDVRMIELICDPPRPPTSEEIAAGRERERASLWAKLPGPLRALIDQEVTAGHPIPEDIIRSLANVNFQEQQPSTPEQWRTLLNALVRSLNPA